MPPRKSISSIPPLPKEGFVRLPQVLAVIPVRNQNRKVSLPHQTWPQDNGMACGGYPWTH